MKGGGGQEAPCQTDPRRSLQRILLSRLGFTVITNFRLPGPRVLCTFLKFPEPPPTYPRALCSEDGSKAKTLVQLPASLFVRTGGLLCMKAKANRLPCAPSAKGGVPPKGVLILIEPSVLDQSEEQTTKPQVTRSQPTPPARPGLAAGLSAVRRGMTKVVEKGKEALGSSLWPFSVSHDSLATRQRGVCRVARVLMLTKQLLRSRPSTL
jgi:hypothetical protein